MKAKEAGMNTGSKALAEALHQACIALERVRREHDDRVGRPADEPPAPDREWIERVGRHVVLAVAAIPEQALRAWLCDERTIGGEEVLRTLRAGAGARAGVAGAPAVGGGKGVAA